MANRVKALASAAIAAISGRRLGEVDTDLAAVRKRRDTAQGRLEAARTAREVALDADDEVASRKARDAVLEAEDGVESARRKLERLEAERLEIAYRDEQTAKAERYDVAKGEVATAAARLQKRYPALALEIVELLRAVAQADAAAAIANADLPDGTQPIALIVDSLLTWNSQPEQVIESKERELWCRDNVPVPDALQKDVEHNGTIFGVLHTREQGVPTSTIPVRLRRVVEEVVRPAAGAELYSFAGELNLPGLAYEAPYLTPAPSDAPGAVLEHLDLLAAGRASREHKPIRRSRILSDV